MRAPVFSSDGRSLASLSHNFANGDWTRSEVKLWNTSSGAELAGVAEKVGSCYQIVFSSDGESLVTIETPETNPEAPIREWKLSKDRMSVALGESISGNEIQARLAPESRRVNSSTGSFRLSDLLAVTPDEDSTIAIGLETGETFLYTTSSGYIKAVCRVEGTEVVFIPRTDLFLPYDQAAVEEIGRRACTLTGSARARPLAQNFAVLQCAVFSRRAHCRCSRTSGDENRRQTAYHRCRDRSNCC